MGKRGIVEDIKSNYTKAKKKNKYIPFILTGVLSLFILGGLYFGTDIFQGAPEQTYMVYGVYSDGTYGQLGSTDEEGSLSITELAIYDPDSSKRLDGFLIMAFVDFKKTFGEYGGTYILYNYYMDKGTTQRVYERPWVVDGQFVKDPGFSSGPPDTLGANVVRVDNLYWWKMTPSPSARIVALADQLTPTRAYPVTYNGVTGNPIIFWIDNKSAEQSYSNQLKLPVGLIPQEYTLTVNLHVYGPAGKITYQKQTSTLRLTRDTLDPNQIALEFYGSKYVYN